MQIVAYAVGVALVVLALTKWKRASAVIFGALAVMWAGMAVGYMWTYFADINKAANLFGVIFLAQAVLLAVMAVRERGVSYGGRRDARTGSGLPSSSTACSCTRSSAWPSATGTRGRRCSASCPAHDDLHLRHAAARGAAEAPAPLAAARVVGDRFLRRGEVRDLRGRRSARRRASSPPSLCSAPAPPPRTPGTRGSRRRRPADRSSAADRYAEEGEAHCGARR